MRFLGLLLFMAILTVPGAAQDEEALDRAARREAFIHSLTELRAAEQFASQFLDGDIEAIDAAMSDTLKRRLSAVRLAEQRERLLDVGGGLRLMQAAEWVHPPDLSSGGVRRARVPIVLERGEAELLLAWQGDWREGGLRELSIRPVRARVRGQELELDHTLWGERPDAEYVDRDRFREVTRRIPAASGTLTGHLTIPREAEEGRRVPAVFLLPDLEAPDIDGIIGPNPFQRDLAHGLASRGILVLRAEPAGEDSTQTVYTPHFVNDAAVATRTLATTLGADLDRVYLLAQRESAFFLPEVAERLPGLRGMALLSPLLRVDAPAHLTRLEALDELGVTPHEPEYYDLHDRAERLEETGLRPQDILLGRPVAWWEDVRQRRSLQKLPQFEGPVLVAMPGNDPLRPEGAAQRWRELDERMPRLHVEWLSGATHWLTDRAGDGGPGERHIPGHLSGRVIDRLERFFKEAE